MSHPSSPLSWDIFCNVIDNYGDIGVAWRLARQLHHDHGQQIRLWVDDLGSFSRLCPALDKQAARQTHSGIEVRHWLQDFPDDALPADVVLDAFGCTPPEAFLQAMAARAHPPVWINLEYLSAEAWIECCHGMVSPHPTLPLRRYFFFPGFSEKTGGVIAERGLDTQVQDWQAHSAPQDDFWRTLGLPPRQPDEYRISLFSYENQAIGELLRQWASGPYPVRCLVPEGRILPDITASFCRQPLAVGDAFQQGALSLHVLPFSDQDSYDRLLWSCDLNFVRGEDSFMRAQWAARPFVWHIYPQQESAHWVKLDAFWQRYTQGLPPEASQALLALNHAWNHGQDIAGAWTRFNAQRAALNAHATRWPGALLAHGDLASRLLDFIDRHR